jgi:hypothetical protein
MGPSPPKQPPLLQFSLQGLLILTAIVAIAAAFYRLVVLHREDSNALVHYCFLIFAVGPWFAHLASECLPVSAPQLRTAVANITLLVLFILTLKLAEATLPGPIVIVVAVAAVILWTPQYMIFFVWRMDD